MVQIKSDSNLQQKVKQTVWDSHGPLSFLIWRHYMRSSTIITYISIKDINKSKNLAELEQLDQEECAGVKAEVDEYHKWGWSQF